MLDSTVSVLASQWFDEYSRLAYWLARRWSYRLLYSRGRGSSANEVEELAQDSVCRGYDRFLKRCRREVCGASDRKRWVCQCVTRGVMDAIRRKSTFGSITSPVAIRDDAMNRFQRVTLGFTHGDDSEKHELNRVTLAQVSDVPINHPVQRWELEQLVSRELPAELQATALYAACDLTQEQAATLQGVTDRTVRNRLVEIRALLG